MGRNTVSRWIRALISMAVAGLLLGGINTAHADANAYTDDKSVDVPVNWWTYTNLAPSAITNLLNSNQARLTDIEPYDTAGTTFTVTMVRNSGAYAVPGWYWYTGLTSAQVGSNLSANSARLIDIEPYTTSAGIRFAVIMVTNTGAAARGWNYLVGVSSAQIDTFIKNAGTTSTPKRIVDLKSYTEGGTKKYVMVAVNNTGTDAKSWQYFYNQTAANVNSQVSSFTGRITVLERQADGTYNFVQVKNTGTDAHYWRYYYGLTSLAQANNVATQFGSRVFDIETYVAGNTRLYNALMIDDANAETRRIRTAFGTSLQYSNGLPDGQWGAYLKPMGAGPLISLNGTRRFEPASAIKAVHNLALMLKVQGGSPKLTDTLVRYQYPSDTGYDFGYEAQKGLTPNACPHPEDEIAANRVSSTIDALKDAMMSVSDNRATRAITLFFGTGSNQTDKGISGIAAIQNVAVNSGTMMNTFVEQPRIGCGYADGKRNQTTLEDLGKLYERVQTGTLLGTGANRTEFYQPMNGGAFDSTSGDEATIKQVVQQEGSALGKTTAQINDFISHMDWRFKPGGYSIGCTEAQPFSPCSAGHIAIATQGGQLKLPRKVNGALTDKFYVFGDYVTDLNACNTSSPSNSSDSCTACPSCKTETQRDTVLSNVKKELFRSVIHENLATY